LTFLHPEEKPEKYERNGMKNSSQSRVSAQEMNNSERFSIHEKFRKLEPEGCLCDAITASCSGDSLTIEIHKIKSLLRAPFL
jgi:hypothetical protein